VIRRRLAAAAVLLAAGLSLAQQKSSYPDPNEGISGNPLVREGDSWFNRRQERRVGLVANREPISAAVRAYETASEAADNLEARWKLARALNFRALFTDLDAAARLAALERARRAGEDAIAILQRRARARGSPEFETLAPGDVAAACRKEPDAPPTFYWAAASWGRWGIAKGKVEAVRVGAAEKVKRYAEILIALDPAFEDGGGYRILGRVHDQAPMMVESADWVSRAEALSNLRLAVQTSPADFANRLYLAEALARGTPAERTEGVSMLEQLVRESPSPVRLVEELRVQDDARRDLDQAKRAASG
jgi:hypothetical protein